MITQKNTQTHSPIQAYILAFEIAQGMGLEIGYKINKCLNGNHEWLLFAQGYESYAVEKVAH